MTKTSSILYFTLLLCLFQIYLSSKKIMVIEGNNIDSAIKNSMEGKSKLFLIFTVKNCPYCSHALKILKEKVVKNFEEEEEIFFGHVDLDNQLNVWLGIRFNITKIPYIILIENNKIFHFESQFEESLVLKFINEEKNLEEGEDIPREVHGAALHIRHALPQTEQHLGPVHPPLCPGRDRMVPGLCLSAVCA